MERLQGLYALIQFAASPERFEFVNVGIVLLVPQIGFVGTRFANGQKRIERAFGPQPKLYIDALKSAFDARLKHELSKGNPEKRIVEFSNSRANEIRISPLQSVAVEDANVLLSKLFDELVGDEQVSKREQKVATKLRNAFNYAGILGLIDEKPEPVSLPEHGVKVAVPFGYQNGSYNLVAAIRMGGDPGEALREAGRRAIEGELLAKHFADRASKKRLMVVADFAKQSEPLVRTVQEIMGERNVPLFRLDKIEPLVSDIRENAERHSRQASGRAAT